MAQVSAVTRVPNAGVADGRSAVPVVEFTPFEVPGQRTVYGNTFPLALQLENPTADTTLDDVIAKIQQLAKEGTVRDLLNKHGALLFRGVPIKARNDLVEFVRAFGFKREHQEIGLSGLRSRVVSHIKTASEQPGSYGMNFHNEYARTNHYPEIVFFYSERVADQGGRTPLLSSQELYDRVLAELPDFVAELEAKGVIDRQYYPSKDDPEAAAIGWNWQDSYGFSIQPGDSLAVQRQKVEQLLRDEIHAEAQWQPNGALHVVQRVPAIRRLRSSGRSTFFNGLTGVYGTAKQLGALEPPYKAQDSPVYKLPSTYGDGTLIPYDYLERLIEIQDSIGFMVPWQNGDVAVVNNYSVQHSREKFVGNRVVLVSLWDDIDDFER